MKRLLPALSILSLLALATTTAPSCTEEAFLLPEDYTPGRTSQFVIKPAEQIQGAAATVRPLNGMDGSPEPIVEGDCDLKEKYWGRLTGQAGDDGAHVRITRVGVDQLCNLTLNRIFTVDGLPDDQDQRNAVINDPSNYDFATLDQHMNAALELNTSQLMWTAIGNPGAGTCRATADGRQLLDPILTASDGEAWAQIAYNTLIHLRDGVQTEGDFPDGNGRDFPIRYVEFMGDPALRMQIPQADGAVWNRIFLTYADFARSTLR